jgi:hypothetical protein
MKALRRGEGPKPETFFLYPFTFHLYPYAFNL